MSNLKQRQRARRKPRTPFKAIDLSIARLYDSATEERREAIRLKAIATPPVGVEQLLDIRHYDRRRAFAVPHDHSRTMRIGLGLMAYSPKDCGWRMLDPTEWKDLRR